MELSVFASARLLLQLAFLAVAANAWTGREVLQAGSNCDVYSSHPNACFNADGSKFVCCGPESCPGVPGLEPKCASAQGSVPATVTACDPTSNTPNTCYNADGTSFTCCGYEGCPTDPGNLARCAVNSDVLMEVEFYFEITASNFSLSTFGQQREDALVAALSRLDNVTEVVLLATAEGSWRGILRIRRRIKKAIGDVVDAVKEKQREVENFVKDVGNVTKQVIYGFTTEAIPGFLVDLVRVLFQPGFEGIAPSEPCSQSATVCPYTFEGSLVCANQCHGGENTKCPAYVYNTDGCGTGISGPIAKLIAAFGGAYVATNNACDHHDLCYITPGASRMECDTELGNRLIGACSIQFPVFSKISAVFKEVVTVTPNPLDVTGSLLELGANSANRVGCIASAEIIATAVRTAGGIFFDRSQINAAEYVKNNCTTTRKCYGVDEEKGIAKIGFRPDNVYTVSTTACSNLSYSCLDYYTSSVPLNPPGASPAEAYAGSFVELYSPAFVNLEEQFGAKFVGVFRDRYQRICNGESTTQIFETQIREIFCGCNVFTQPGF